MCVFFRVSPANVTVMLTGVAHEAIHLLQLELRLAAAAPSAAAAAGKSAASAAKLLHQHFVCIRGSTCVLCACMCVCMPI